MYYFSTWKQIYITSFMYVTPSAPIMSVLAKKRDIPDLNIMQTKHQEDTTKKDDNLRKSQTHYRQYGTLT